MSLENLAVFLGAQRRKAKVGSTGGSSVRSNEAAQWGRREQRNVRGLANCSEKESGRNLAAQIQGAKEPRQEGRTRLDRRMQAWRVIGFDFLYRQTVFATSTLASAS